MVTAKHFLVKTENLGAFSCLHLSEQVNMYKEGK